MTRARKLVYDKFIKPFEGKTSKNTGVELEFPLINNNGGDIDKEYVSAIMDFLESKGYKAVLFGTGGEKLFMENSYGDCLSFDNSYNNFEFSLNYSDNLNKLNDRFQGYMEMVQNYLGKKNHSLFFGGTNPHYREISVNHVPFSTYDMVSEYLHGYESVHNYPDFPAFMSSVQTHLDVCAEDLCHSYNVFSRMDFIRGMLFHNSPDYENKGMRIFRDYLWAKSAFGHSPNITGTVDKVFQNNEEIVDFFLSKGLFNRIRDGKYETFEPCRISEYFENDSYGARDEDIDCYLSFCNVEITSRGTLEVRGDCTQKEGKSFLPPAFNLGILENIHEAEKCVDEFFLENNISKTNSELRRIVGEGESYDLIAPESQIKSLLENVKQISLEGLQKRGKGEEKLLNF